MGDTKQRRIVLGIMHESDGHMTAEEVYRSAKTKMPKIGLATVYRNLNKLVEEGKLSKIELGKDSVTYDVTTELHAHLVCTKCSRVYDIPVDSRIFQKAMVSKKFRATEYSMVVRGLCERCDESGDYTLQ